MKPAQPFGSLATTAARAFCLALAALASGCSGILGGATGPVQAGPVEGWSLEIGNVQHSRVWTFNGFEACVSEPVPDLQFGAVGLVQGRGTVSVRAGIDVTGKVPADVEPKPLRKGLLPAERVSGSQLPVTGCPSPTTNMRFSFEVTFDEAWSTDGFQLDYRTAGVTRTLSWNLPVTTCAPSGC